MISEMCPFWVPLVSIRSLLVLRLFLVASLPTNPAGEKVRSAPDPDRAGLNPAATPFVLRYELPDWDRRLRCIAMRPGQRGQKWLILQDVDPDSVTTSGR